MKKTRSSRQRLVNKLKIYMRVSCLVLIAPQTVLGNLPLEASNQAQVGARPIVGVTGSGVPMVHIAPPGSGGVSRNQYEHFNVNANGLILNNSTNRNTQTQLGGSVGRNQQSGFSSARVILNEVLSRHPSQLLGKLEVAGARANVVIANPNGITCNGCGFINTGRATLTTGATRFGLDGKIQGFDVRQGEVRFEGAGLDARQLERLDLIARGIVIEGEVRAQELNMVTGANQVRYDTLEATAQTGDEGTPPQFAVDIKDVGGMHANQIYLVATEKGLGVNSTGRVEALQGNLTLSANGDLKLGNTRAQQEMKLESQGKMELSGQTMSGKKMYLSSKGELTQKGMLGSQGQMSIDTASLGNTGQIVLNGTDNLSIVAQEKINNRGVIYSGGSMNLATSYLAAEGGKFLALGDLSVKANGINLLNTQVKTNRHLNMDVALGDIVTHNAQIASINNLNFIAKNVVLHGNVENRGEAHFTLSGDYRNESVFSGHDLIFSANHVYNNGKLSADGKLTIHAQGDLVNMGSGEISSAKTNTVHTAGMLTNQGLINSGSLLNLVAANLNDTGGKFLALGDLNIQSNAINLSNTQIKTNQNLSINVAQGDARAENVQIAAMGNLNLTAKNTFLSGSMGSQGDTNLTLENYHNESIFSARNFTFSVNNLHNAGKLLASDKLAINVQGNLVNTSRGDISAKTNIVRIANTLSNEGVINGAYTQLNANLLNNMGGIYGDDMWIHANQTNNQGRAAVIGLGRANGQLRMSGGVVTNTAGALIYSSGMLLFGSDFDANGNALGQIGRLVNSSSTIKSSGYLDANVAHLTNQKEHFATMQVEIEKDILIPLIFSYRTVTKTIVTANSEPGRILSHSDMRLTGAIMNDKSEIKAGGNINYNPLAYQGIGAPGTVIQIEKGMFTCGPPVPEDLCAPSYDTIVLDRYDLSRSTITGNTLIAGDQINLSPTRTVPASITELSGHIISKRRLLNAKNGDYVESLKGDDWTEISQQLNR